MERIPRSIGLKLGIEWSRRRDRMGRWKTLYPIVRARIHPLLSDRVRARDAEYWSSFLSGESSLKSLPVLNHGDLFPHHILVNDRGVTGILDWESACYEDPVGNVTGLPAANGFATRVIRGYLGDDASVRARIAFHRHTVPAHSIVHGLDTKDPRKVAIAVRQYAGTIPKLNLGSHT